MSHDIRYCETHSGAELARVKADLDKAVENNAGCLSTLDEVRADRDALAAAYRLVLRLVDDSHGLFRHACEVATDAIKRGLSVEDGGRIMRESVECGITAINRAIEHLDTSREVARVEKLEAAIRRALADSESGQGWGPDVTVCAYLREALGE